MAQFLRRWGQEFTKRERNNLSADGLTPAIAAINLPVQEIEHRLNAALLPENPSFAGHQTFALRFNWLKKGFDALEEQGPDFFAREDALSVLGVGKNMVAAIRHYLLSARVAEERRERGRTVGLIPTDFGEAVFGTGGLDPFLEKDATLFLLHWRMAGPGSSLFTWVYAFNLFRGVEFSRETLTEAVLREAARLSRAPSAGTIERDVDCLLQTYVASPARSVGTARALTVEELDTLDSPLRSLGLIRPAFEHTYRFAYGPKPGISPTVFAYALADYWQQFHPAKETLSLREVCYGEAGPGTVFKLGEEDVYGYLDTISDITGDGIRFEDTTQIRQVVRSGPIPDRMELLKRCYRARRATPSPIVTAAN